MDVFITCGKDGSIRLFDMRCLDRYSVLHQNKEELPILRLAWNPINSMTVGYICENQNIISLVDIRSPEQELRLESHTTPVSAIDWSPNQENFLISAGEDSKVMDMRDNWLIVLDMGLSGIKQRQGM